MSSRRDRLTITSRLHTFSVDNKRTPSFTAGGCCLVGHELTQKQERWQLLRIQAKRSSRKTRIEYRYWRRRARCQGADMELDEVRYHFNIKSPHPAMLALRPDRHDEQPGIAPGKKAIFFSNVGQVAYG